MFFLGVHIGTVEIGCPIFGPGIGASVCRGPVVVTGVLRPKSNQRVT